MTILIATAAAFVVLAVVESVVSDPRKQARSAVLRGRKNIRSDVSDFERQAEALRVKKLAFDRKIAGLAW